MSKNKKILLILATFVALSVACGFMIFQYLSPQRATIFVFNNNYSAGTQITSDMLTPVQVDANIVLNGQKASAELQFVTLNEYSTVLQSGDSLRTDVGTGMPLMLSMLSVTGGSIVEMNMKSTSVGVTVPINNITGITPELKQGSRVNVYMSINGVTTLIMENMRVLSVYTEDGYTLTGATIECDINESLILINSASYGSIHLGLVDSNGYQYSDVKNPNFSYVVSPSNNETIE